MNTLSQTKPCLALLLAFGALACSPEGEALREETVTEIGVAGGVARSSDGLLAAEFESGALSETTDVTITVTREHNRSGLLSPIYTLGPDGLAVDAPITVTMEAPDGSEPLALARLTGSTFTVIADSTQNGRTLRATLARLSTLAIVVGNPPTTTPPVSLTHAEVTGGATSVFLDAVALDAAGLQVTGVSEEVAAPGDLGPDSVAFPINSRTSPGIGNNLGDTPSTFVYDYDTFAPVSGTIEHDGFLFFTGMFGSGNFSVGFDAARVSGTNSGFFVESTTEGFLLVPGVFFDVATPDYLDAQPSSLTIEADLIVSPEFAALRNRPNLAGAVIGRVLLSATAQPVQ